MARFTSTPTTQSVLQQRQTEQPTSGQTEQVSVSYEQLRSQGREINFLEKQVRFAKEKLQSAQTKLSDRTREGRSSPGTQARVQRLQEQLENLQGQLNNLREKYGREQYAASKRSAPKDYNLSRGEGTRASLKAERQQRVARFAREKKNDQSMREEASQRPGIYTLSTGESIVSSLQPGSFKNSRGQNIVVREPIGTRQGGGYLYPDKPSQSTKTYTGFNLFDAQTRTGLLQAVPRYSTVGEIYESAQESEPQASFLNYSSQVAQSSRVGGLAEATYRTGLRDFQRGIEYGKKLDVVRASNPTTITGRIGKYARTIQYGTLARGNVILGIGTGTVGQFEQKSLDVGSDLLAAGQGAVFGGLQRSFERLSLKKGAVGVVGKTGSVVTKTGGVALGGWFVLKTAYDVSQVPTRAQPQEESFSQITGILGGSAQQLVFFSAGNAGATSAFPSYPGQTSGPKGNVQVSSRARNTFATQSLDLTRVSQTIAGSERFSQRTTTLKYKEELSGFRFNNPEVSTVVTRRPSGFTRRVQTYQDTKIVTRQASNEGASQVQIFKKGKLSKSFTGPDIVGSPVSLGGASIIASQKSSKNLAPDVLLQQTKEVSSLGVESGGFKGELKGASRARSLSVGETGGRGAFEVFTLNVQRPGVPGGVERVSTGSKVVEQVPVETNVVVGSRERVLFENSLNTKNLGREVLSVDAFDKSVLFSRQVRLARKGRVSSVGEIQSRFRGRIYKEEAFSSSLLGKRGELGGQRFRQRLRLQQRSVGELGRGGSRVVLPDLNALSQKPAFALRSSLNTGSASLLRQVPESRVSPAGLTSVSSRSRLGVASVSQTSIASTSVGISTASLTSVTTQQVSTTRTGFDFITTTPGVTTTKTPGGGGFFLPLGLVPLQGRGGKGRGSRSREAYSVSLETIENINVGGGFSVKGSPRGGLFGVETRKSPVSRKPKRKTRKTPKKSSRRKRKT